MLLEKWMIAALLGVFCYALVRTWRLAYTKGIIMGVEIYQLQLEGIDDNNALRFNVVASKDGDVTLVQFEKEK